MKEKLKIQKSQGGNQIGILKIKSSIIQIKMKLKALLNRMEEVENRVLGIEDKVIRSIRSENTNGTCKTSGIPSKSQIYFEK
jgi:low affinity Fe/Cu permease